MAEFYAVLKKAVSGIEPHSSDARRAIYDKARNALIGQLKAIEPPLSASEISRQRLELEESIRRVEREANSPQQAPFARPSEPPRAPPPRYPAAEAARPPPPRYPAPEPARPAPSRYSEEPRSADQPRGGPNYGSPRPEPSYGASRQEPSFSSARQQPAFEPEVAHPDAHFDPVPPSIPPAPAPDLTVGQQAFQRAVLDAERQSASRPQPRRRPEPEPRAARVDPPFMRQPAAPPPPAGADPMFDLGGPVEPAPRLAPEFDWGTEPAAKGNEPPTPMVDRPMPGEGSRSEREAPGHRGRAGTAPDRSRPSRLPAILLTIMLLGVLGGIGALAWSFRDKLPAASNIIGDVIASFDQHSGSGTAPPAESAPTSDAMSADALSADAGKDAGRLGDPNPAPAANVRRVDAPDDPSAPLAFAPDAPAADTLADDTQVASAPPRADDPAQLAVAQKAILYEENAGADDTNKRVTALDAAVTWNFVDSGPNGPAVVADVDVPDRKMHVRITVTKNTDPSLPATHLIELQVTIPQDFPGGGIQAIPRLVVKQNEEARGDPLVGDAQKVVDGLFWIALSSDQALAQANITSLRELDWFDLPLLYTNNQRAIMTFEKGVPGEQAFQKAFAAWGE